MTNNVVVDQAAALGLIDELRVAVPEEVRAAKRINSEGERIIEKAQEEAERIVARAQEQAAFLIDERGLTQQAEADSRRIIGEAEADAEDVRRGADEYAVNVLVGLEGDVVKTLQSIKKGIDLLDSRRTDLRADEQNGAESRGRRLGGPGARVRRRGGRAPGTPMSVGRALGAPLVWNVSGLLADDPGASRDYDVAGVTIDLGEELRLADPIEGRVHLARTNRGLLLRAEFETAIEAQCSRCLRDIEVPIQVSIEDEVLPSIDFHTGAPVPPEPGDDEPIRLTDHHELDLETADP